MSITNIATKQTPAAEQSMFIRREVERLMFQGNYEGGYELYLTDPTLTDPEDFETFVSNNK